MISLLLNPTRFTLKVQQGSVCEFIVLHFSFSQRKSNSSVYYPSDIPIEDFINFFTEQKTGPFLKLKVNHKNEIITLLNRIVTEQSEEQFGSEFLVYLLILELFVMISRVLKLEWERSILEDSLNKELVNLAVQYINNYYERDINLSDMWICF